MVLDPSLFSPFIKIDAENKKGKYSKRIYDTLKLTYMCTDKRLCIFDIFKAFDNTLIWRWKISIKA